MEKELRVDEDTNQHEGSLLDDLNDIRNNYVPKEKYDKLVKDNKDLMEYIKSGQADIDAEHEAEIVRTTAEISKDLFGFKSDDQTNIEKAELILDFCDAFKREHGYLPTAGKNADPETIAKAENTLGGLQKCLEMANGSPERFNAELSTILQEGVRRR